MYSLRKLLVDEVIVDQKLNNSCTVIFIHFYNYLFFFSSKV